MQYEEAVQCVLCTRVCRHLLVQICDACLRVQYGLMEYGVQYSCRQIWVVDYAPGEAGSCD